jgi:hypothetical protein
MGLVALFLFAQDSAAAGDLGLPFEKARPGDVAAASEPETGEQLIARLLEEYPSTGTLKANLGYVRRCERALEKYPSTPQTKEICRRIGEIYWSIGKFRQMEHWSRRAIALDSEMAKTTPIGFYLEKYEKMKFKRNGIAAGGAVLVCMLALVAAAMVRRGRMVAWPSLVRTLVIFFVLYALAAGLVLHIDYARSAQWALQLDREKADLLSIILPIIPLNFIDDSQIGYSALALLLGFFPVLLAIVLSSMARPWSRLSIAGITLGSALSLWTLFYFILAYSRMQEYRGFAAQGRWYFLSDPQPILEKYPQKALRANPDLLKCGDSDILRHFQKQ